MYKKRIAVILFIICIFMSGCGNNIDNKKDVHVVSPLHATKPAIKVEDEVKSNLLQVLNELSDEIQEQELVIGLPYIVTIEDDSSKIRYYINSNHIRKVQRLSDNKEDVTWYQTDSKIFNEISSIIKSVYQNFKK